MVVHFVTDARNVLHLDRETFCPAAREVREGNSIVKRLGRWMCWALTEAFQSNTVQANRISFW